MTAARSPPPLELDVSERELDKLKQKVERIGQIPPPSAFYVDRQRKKWEHGNYHCLHHAESFTDKRHYTIIVAPGHRDFIKNKTTDALQVGTALIMVAADGSFATAIAKDFRKEGENQGQISQHSRLINTLRVRQTRIGVNRIECDAAGCKQEKVL